jgi:hypothetical protein
MGVARSIIADEQGRAGVSPLALRRRESPHARELDAMSASG